jgi:hypothetical protein
VIRQTFDQALRRDPEQRRRWVALVDSNRGQIAIIGKAAKERSAPVILMLDLMHVLDLHRM